MSSPARPQYGEAHQRTSERLIAAHVAQHGAMCPGIPGVTDLHPATDLVADHLSAGRPEYGYQVICRSCNSKRRALGLG